MRWDDPVPILCCKRSASFLTEKDGLITVFYLAYEGMGPNRMNAVFTPLTFVILVDEMTSAGKPLMMKACSVQTDRAQHGVQFHCVRISSDVLTSVSLRPVHLAVEY